MGRLVFPGVGPNVESDSQSITQNNDSPRFWNQWSSMIKGTLFEQKANPR